MQSLRQCTTKKLSKHVLGFVCCVVLALPTRLWAGSVTMPYTFHNGDAADANQVNANFTLLQDAVNGLHITIMDIANTAVGTFTLSSNTTGGNNTASGFGAFLSNTTGSNNTAIGIFALSGNTTGSSNIAVGSGAGATLTKGDNNIYLGNPGQATESGTIRLGTIGVHTQTFIAGDVFATSFTLSDARLKTDVRPLTHVLEKLDQLHGVSFAWTEAAVPLTGHAAGQRDIGVLAQEIEAMFPELVTAWGEEGYKAVAYEKLTGVLLAAVKELKAAMDTQQQHIGALEARLTALERASRPGDAPALLAVFSAPTGWPLWAALLSLVAYTWHRRKRA